MRQFTNTQRGKSFVWFLGSVSRWQSVINEVQALEDNGQLSDEQSVAFALVKAGQAVCGSHKDDWDAIPIWAKCDLIDELIDIGVEEREQVEIFQDLMTDPQNGRYWVETKVANTASGTVISDLDSLGRFLGGLKNLIALLKQETRFDQ